jgi:hypothetical protein
MTRDELEHEVRELREKVDEIEHILHLLLEVNNPDWDHDGDQGLRDLAVQFRPRDDETFDDLNQDIDELKRDIRSRSDQLHKERAKVARRLSTVEDEVGIARTDALAIAEGGDDARHMSKLGRLVRHGPAAVSDNPTAKMYRAKELVENWNRWGTVRNDKLGKQRRLSSSKHKLKSRLSDARDESLSWVQVYRAMELVADWSDRKVDLEDGSQDEGQYVLVHRMDEDEEVDDS